MLHCFISLNPFKETTSPVCKSSHLETTFSRTVIKYGNSTSGFRAESMSIISLLSDFGHKDPYVAEMKAVILSINPHAQIVDISHEIEKFSIHMGAYALASAAPYFPQGTIHVAVVDPGVGTKRCPIIVETNHSLYVGPDNGLLMLAVSKSIKYGISSVSTIMCFGALLSSPWSKPASSSL